LAAAFSASGLAALAAFASRAAATLVSLTSRTADSDQGTGYRWRLCRKIRSLLSSGNGLRRCLGVGKGLLDRGFFLRGSGGESRIDHPSRERK